MEWQHDYGDRYEGYHEGTGFGWRLRLQRVRQQLTILVLFVLVASLLIFGLRNETARGLLRTTQTGITTLWRWGEERMAAYTGPDLLLRRRAQRTFRQLEQEELLLQALAENSGRNAAELAEMVAQLQREHATIQMLMLRLAQQIASGELLSSDIRAIDGVASEEIMVTMLREYHRLSSTSSMYEANYRTLGTVTEEARTLYATTEHLLTDIEVSRALLEGMVILIEEQRTVQPLQGDGLLALSDQLRAILQQSQAVTLARKALEGQARNAAVDFAALETIVQDSHSLLEQLRNATGIQSVTDLSNDE